MSGRHPDDLAKRLQARTVGIACSPLICDASVRTMRSGEKDQSTSAAVCSGQGSSDGRWPIVCVATCSEGPCIFTFPRGNLGIQARHYDRHDSMPEKRATRDLWVHSLKAIVQPAPAKRKQVQRVLNNAAYVSVL